MTSSCLILLRSLKISLFAGLVTIACYPIYIVICILLWDSADKALAGVFPWFIVNHPLFAPIYVCMGTFFLTWSMLVLKKALGHQAKSPIGYLQRCFAAFIMLFIILFVPWTIYHWHQDYKFLNTPRLSSMPSTFYEDAILSSRSSEVLLNASWALIMRNQRISPNTARLLFRKSFSLSQHDRLNIFQCLIRNPGTPPDIVDQIKQIVAKMNVQRSLDTVEGTDMKYLDDSIHTRDAGMSFY
jgi:hypothetical protein